MKAVFIESPVSRMNKAAIQPSRVGRRNTQSALSPNLGALEWFLIIQLLASGLVLLPGMSQLRIVFRALPYVSSLAILFWSLVKRKSLTPPLSCHYWLVGSLIILGVSVFLHPFSILASGAAQFIYQLCIAAPLFWVRRYSVNLHRLRRLIWILFLCSAISTTVGALQTYLPDTFMPKDFTSGLEEDYIRSMTYEGANGNIIMRPPGLTDLPGGAATAAVITAFLGLVLMTRVEARLGERMLCGMLATIGLFVLYLTQVRSYFIDLVAVFLIVAILRVMKKRISAAIQMVGIGASLVFAAYIWAVSIGGEQVSERFTGLIEQGVFESFEQNRGSSVSSTFQEYLPRFPLGAGVGRWGIINLYFGQNSNVPALYAEIQITGWVFDGGLPLLTVYSVAILFALANSFRIARLARTNQWEVVTQMILCVNLLVTAQAFAGPAFNTQLGTLFWFLTAVLHQAINHNRQPSQGHPMPCTSPALDRVGQSYGTRVYRAVGHID